MVKITPPETITAREYRDAVNLLRAEMGPRALISTFVMEGDEPMYCAVYPTGDVCSGPEFTIRGETFAALLAALREKIVAHAETYRLRTIRKMALAIIRITAELGECTDAALRNCGEFDPDQVKAYGEQACSDANEIAGKGPFTIVASGGANVEAA
jgi:hypothetical protein